MDCAFHIDDPRQRVADYAAVLVLNRAAAQQVDLPIAQLGPLVAAFLPSVGPDGLRAWRDLDMAQAVRSIKLDLLRLQIAAREAEVGSPLSEQDTGRMDEEISQSVLASVFKFMTIRALNPGWYTPHLTETPDF